MLGLDRLGTSATRVGDGLGRQVNRLVWPRRDPNIRERDADGAHGILLESGLGATPGSGILQLRTDRPTSVGFRAPLVRSRLLNSLRG